MKNSSHGSEHWIATVFLVCVQPAFSNTVNRAGRGAQGHAAEQGVLKCLIPEVAQSTDRGDRGGSPHFANLCHKGVWSGFANRILTTGWMMLWGSTQSKLPLF